MKDDDRMREKQRGRALIAALSIALAAAAGVAIRTAYRAKEAESRLREMYGGAVLSALRQTEDIELSLEKALLSDDQEARDRYLARIGAGADQVQRSLSLLPLSHPVGKNAVKFANQVSDYATHLIGGEIAEAEEKQLTGLIGACRAYTAALNDAREALPVRAAAGEAFYGGAEGGDGGSYDSDVSYPTLIYDGPFSDARDTGNAKALGGRAVSKEEALALAREAVGEDRVMSVSPGADMGGSIPCWGVTLHLAEVFPEKSLEDCRESALVFLRRCGYENMQPTYFQVYEGVAVISFAASQGDAILYPDLVKVQLRMDTAQVVGLEARNYLTNHTARGALIPKLTAEEAAGAVSARLRIDQGRLCLIPTDAGERLCYEFRGTWGERVYLCYINAENGRQEQLLQLIEGETGVEAV